MKILVTGGAGFIGSHIVDRYIELGHDVTVIDNLSTGKKDNINPEADKFYTPINNIGGGLDQIISQGKFDVINHHAAQTSVIASMKDFSFDAEINILGTLNLLKIAIKHKVKKFIFASSGGAIYGLADVPTNENSYPFPRSPYGISKLAIELYLSIFQEHYGLNYTSLRYSNVYGPRQRYDGEAGVIAIFTNAMLNGQSPTIFGDGFHERDYIYVDDVVEANIKALTKGDNEAINIGTGITTTTQELFNFIKKATGFNGIPVYGAKRPGDIWKSGLDISKAKEILGWEPKIKLEEGISQTVDYFKNQT